MGIVRLPVSHKTCTVLGYKAKSADEPLWAGLDLSRAEPRYQSALGLMIAGTEAPRDIHLAVPWCHPADQTGHRDDFDCIYRVRPKAEIGRKWKGRMVEDVCFERWRGDWLIMIKTKDQKRITTHNNPEHQQTSAENETGSKG